MGAPSSTVTEPTPTPPVHRQTPVEWLRDNLFSSWWNSLLTVVVAPLLAWVIYQFLYFVFVSGRWQIIQVNLTNLMVGPFPREHLWRLWVAAAILAAVVGLGLGVTAATAREVAAAAGRTVRTRWHEPLRRIGPPAALVGVLIVFVRTATPLVLLLAVVVLGALTYGVGRRIPPPLRRLINLVVIVGVVASGVVITQFGGVPQRAWGGLLVTGYFTIGSLLLAFPVGVAVALGRRSTLPVVRWACVLYVEFFRGSPLIALLFMGHFILPFVLPPDFPTPGIVTRALIIFTLFTSAYVAEIVRGGLQSIPRGQWEAAQALGLSPWKQTRLIILPQALRSVIPALVGQAISLFKDTTLVLILGLQDLLAVAQAVTNQEQFLAQGLIAETLVFASLIYWVASYWMSRESQRLEKRLGVGER